MKFEIDFERTFPHPIDKVWQALTHGEALGAWLMKTDFAPEQERSFRMWCDDGEGGTDLYLCKLLELEAPDRMLWSWCLDGMQHEGETHVEFRLDEVPRGTRLVIRHSGDQDPGTVDRFKSGWPVKLEQLEETLAGDRLND